MEFGFKDLSIAKLSPQSRVIPSKWNEAIDDRRLCPFPVRNTLFGSTNSVVCGEQKISREIIITTKQQGKSQIPLR